MSRLFITFKTRHVFTVSEKNILLVHPKYKITFSASISRSIERATTLAVTDTDQPRKEAKKLYLKLSK